MASSSWKFLNPRETAFVVARIQRDRNDALPTQFKVSDYLKNALDLKVWGFAALFGLTTTNSYAIAYFLPVILVRGMGFTVAAGQCLVAPPYVAAAIAMYGMAIVGDRYRIRGPIVMFGALLGLIGLPMLGYAKNNGVRYFGVFLATISANANIPAILTYQANNIRGEMKLSQVVLFLWNRIANCDFRSMEARSLLRDSRRFRGYWRNHRIHGFP
jgi:hypothetical protein